MNPAIEKLEKRIAILKKQQSEVDEYNKITGAYKSCDAGENASILESLKACVEALECSELLGDGGAFQLKRKEAMSLVNRAMGVSHELEEDSTLTWRNDL